MQEAVLFRIYFLHRWTADVIKCIFYVAVFDREGTDYLTTTHTRAQFGGAALNIWVIWG